jgi:hypothetical protein
MLATLREGWRLAAVSVGLELVASGGGAGAGAEFMCELLPTAGGCEALVLLALDFALLVAVADTLELAIALDVCTMDEFPAADRLVAIAAGFEGVGATDGAAECALAESGEVDSTTSTGATGALAAARDLVATLAEAEGADGW